MEKTKNNEHWSRQKEEGSLGTTKFLLFLFKIFPIGLLRIIAFPVGFFYFLFSARAKRESRRFLTAVSEYIEDEKIKKRAKNYFSPLRHIISFALSLLEKIQSWGGKYKLKNVSFYDDDINELIRELESGKGVFLIISHLGNAEVLRGLFNQGQTGVSRKIPFTAIMDIKVTSNFTKMLNEINPESGMDIISADEIGPQTAVILEERLSSGGMVMVAGDRTSAIDKNIKRISFLGKEAPFPSGMFYIAALLNAPVYFIFGFRKKELSIRSKYDMYVHKSGISLSSESTRKERMEQSSLIAESFASLLEKYCKKYPFQWYNFFNFWLNEEER